jgi:tetratricopeptide (TPR) repeat protein
MSMRHRPWSGPLAAAAALLLFGIVARAGTVDVSELLRFGTQMARDGNWREAKFRWERALREDPADARLLNNLAVAEEALGEPVRAKDLYAKAITAAPGDSRINANATRSSLFWRNASDVGAPAAAVPGDPPKKKGRDVVEVTVSLPLPPRMKVDGARTFLVASFLANDSDLVNVNREIVRFLRGEVRKHTSFDVLDVTPVPAVPEQTLEDMAKNAEFFRYLGREHGADIVMSGAIRYSKRDASGFEDVDLISETTGQKVRQTRFVEQEEFTFELDALYFKGADGSLLFRDRMRRQAIFRGTANDPISAFYELGNAVAGDVLSVVAPRTLTGVRLLFKG